MTIQLPAGLSEEISTLAREKNAAMDDGVMEACLTYTEPYFWERSYKEWRKENPNEPLPEFGIRGRHCKSC